LLKLNSFLLGVRKIAKTTISVAMSVCPSARNNSAGTERIFMKLDIRAFFENMSRNLKVR